MKVVTLRCLSCEVFTTIGITKYVRFKIGSYFDTSMKATIEHTIGMWPEFSIWDCGFYPPMDHGEFALELIDDFEFGQMPEGLEGLFEGDEYEGD